MHKWSMKLSSSRLESYHLILEKLAPHFRLMEKRSVEGNQNYRDAFAKSILFFQGQRSGRIPPGAPQEITWRSSSGLMDGHMAGVDLNGGYYDAGDNVKFNLPMAYTTTMLSWGAIEYGRKLGPQLPATRAAIRWATDYLLKYAQAIPGRLYVGVGVPNADHECWESPEDMDAARSVYSVSKTNPGSDVAGEIAAALAAASIVFRLIDPNYSKLLLRTAKSVMNFAMKYRGSYRDSLGGAVCPFYCSYSGYTVNNRDMSIAVLRTFKSRRKQEHEEMMARRQKRGPKVAEEPSVETESVIDSEMDGHKSNGKSEVSHEISQDESCSISEDQAANQERKGQRELKQPRVLEALSASGLKAIRYAREIEGIG